MTVRRFTHLDGRGRARMVDVGDKPVTARTARARGRVALGAATLRALRAGRNPKGDVFAVARLAGIQAAKQTATLVPLCHALPLDHVEVVLRAGTRAITIESRVACRGATGVEMEAIVAVAVAAITVYDMCKAQDRGMRIEAIELVEKAGGRSGTWRRRPARRA